MYTKLATETKLSQDQIDAILRTSTIADYLGSVSFYRLNHKRREQLIICDDPFREFTASQLNDATIQAIQIGRTSYLPYADFSIYNATYHNYDPATDPRDVCGKCNGAGGSTYAEYQGDPPMGAVVNFFESCEVCIGAGLCPGCMQPLAYTFDLSAFGEDTPIVKRATGWYYASNSGIRTIEVIQTPVTINNPNGDPFEGQTYGVYEYDAYQFTADDAMTMIFQYDWFNCSVCGWRYDAERLNNYYPDIDDDYGDYDDPGFDPMFLM